MACWWEVKSLNILSNVSSGRLHRTDGLDSTSFTAISFLSRSRALGMNRRKPRYPEYSGDQRKGLTYTAADKESRGTDVTVGEAWRAVAIRCGVPKWQ